MRLIILFVGATIGRPLRTCNARPYDIIGHTAIYRGEKMRICSRKLEGMSGHDAGRGLLRDMYRELTGEAMPDICVTDWGKPYFPDSAWYFSISHTKGRVFCALSEKTVGIDAEALDRKINLYLADKILSPREKARFDAAGDKRLTLLRFWVLKEAYAKATGRGWGSYLYRTDFEPDDPRVRETEGCLLAVIEE